MALDRTVPRLMLPSFLLLLLAERPSHGYDMIERLKPFGLVWASPSPIYNELRLLEEAGLTCSSEEHPSSGSTRRVHCVTDRGRDELKHAAENLKTVLPLFSDFLSRAGQVGRC